MLAINGLSPLIAVDENAKITGSFQGLGTRQNSCVYAHVPDACCPRLRGHTFPRFFSSYNSAATGWTYILGNFAQQSLPLNDFATLTIQRVNSSTIETVTVSALTS